MIPRSWPPRLPNLASSCGARSDRMARSANMPSCRRTYPSTRWRRDQQSLERRQKHRRLRRSTTKQPARPPLRSRENRSGAIASAGRKRPRGRRNASGASRPSQRPKQRLKKPSVTMKSRSKKSKETALHSTDGRKRRTRAGKSRRRNWKPLCAGRTTSHVAMSQDAQRIDPSVVPGARPAPSPGFIEPAVRRCARRLLQRTLDSRDQVRRLPGTSAPAKRSSRGRFRCHLLHDCRPKPRPRAIRRPPVRLQ
jgi:hypothetical protein